MGTEHAPAKSRLSGAELLMYLALIAASVVPFIGTVGHGYFLMDDFGALHLSKGFKLYNLFDPVFYHSYGTYGFFRPFGLVLWRVNYIMYGFEPAGYFITGLLLHVACTLLVCMITALLAGGNRAGFIAGLVFAVHPAHAEALNWLSCRYDLASAMFYLAGLLLYMKYSRLPRPGLMFYFAAASLEALALMSKEMAVTFPLALVLYELFYPEGGQARPRRILARTAPFFAIAALFILLRVLIFHGLGGYGTHSSAASVPDMATRLGYYLLTLLFGFNLDYPYHVLVISVALVSALSVALTGLVLSAREQKRAALFFAAFVLVTFIPLINFSRITEKFFINSRYMYLSSFGYAAFLGAALSAGLAGRRLKVFAAAAAALFVVCYYGSLMNNNRVWLNKSRLSSAVLEQFKGIYPDSIAGFDVTVVNFPENIFGRNYFIPKNLGYALSLSYGGKGGFTVESGQNMPGNPVRYSRTPREGRTRKVVVAYDNESGRVFPVYDSMAGKK